jgi:hypothetical protein
MGCCKIKLKSYDDIDKSLIRLSKKKVDGKVHAAEWVVNYNFYGYFMKDAFEKMLRLM